MAVDTVREAGEREAVGQSLTEGLVEILDRPVEQAARERAAEHLLDWIGCAVLGATAEVGRIVTSYGSGLGAGPSHAIGVGGCEMGAAAFVNGAYGNVLEMDDIHRTSILHPGPIVVPAALAMAERERASAEAMLDALVRGYEAMIRVGCSVGPGHYRNWHTTATCGPFGAAAAGASLLGLDRPATVAALGNAGTQSSGPWQCRLEGSMSKQLHTARAAQAGLAAADLSALGFTRPREILEGPLGFYAAMCPDPDVDAVAANASGSWLMNETSFKPWPACRHGHATIDAALAVRGEVDLEAVGEVVVRTYPDALAICDNPAPGTVLEAKFSLQHCAAVVLLDGPPGLGAFEPGALARTDVADLRERVRLDVAEPFASSYPRHFGGAVLVRHRNGQERAAEVRDALGDPENPIGAAGVEAKATMVMQAAGQDQGRVRDIIEAARALAYGAPISDLIRHLP